MFGLFRRSNKDESLESAQPVTALSNHSINVPQTESDERLIAVISAAIARFRENESTKLSDAGFIVRRIRRV